MKAARQGGGRLAVLGHSSFICVALSFCFTPGRMIIDYAPTTHYRIGNGSAGAHSGSWPPKAAVLSEAALPAWKDPENVYRFDSLQKGSHHHGNGFGTRPLQPPAIYCPGRNTKFWRRAERMPRPSRRPGSRVRSGPRGAHYAICPCMTGESPVHVPTGVWHHPPSPAHGPPDFPTGPLIQPLSRAAALPLDGRVAGPLDPPLHLQNIQRDPTLARLGRFCRRP